MRNRTASVILGVLAVCLWLAVPVAAQRGRGGGSGAGRGPQVIPPSPSKPERGAPAPKGRPGEGLGSKGALTALEKSPQLATRLQELLPEGMKVTDAASGFENLGQFVSAVHVSRNLDIPFESLKQEIVSGSSMGEAIQKLKPGLTKQEIRREMRRAEVQAQADIKPSGAAQRDRDRERDQERLQQKQP